MQHLIFDFRPVYYFAFGSSQKTSLIAQFCRQNNYLHLKDPIKQIAISLQKKDTIIEGNIQLFHLIQKHQPNLKVIFFGNPQNQNQKIIKNQYCSIGKCIRINKINYQIFRKQLYPNLIFFYGPSKDQISAAAQTLANTIGYTHVVLPKSSNTFINEFNKSINYVVQGLFTSKNQLTILQQYFNMKILHFHYHRSDFPNQSQFFDKQYQILPFLKTKSYYYYINGNAHPVQVMDQVGIALCPQLIYVNKTKQQHNKYIKQYIQDTDGLLLSIHDIQSANKKKNIPLATDVFTKCRLITQILYKDFNRKRVLLTDFPWHTQEFIPFQNLNRKFTYFIDLADSNDYQYNNRYSSPFYFIEQQKRITPRIQNPLKNQLIPKIEYWIISGPSGSGKTTLSKSIASQYDYKLIQYQSYLASIKQKLLGPDDGQQLPFKKIVPYFKNLLKDNSQNIYLFDGLPYQGKDLQTWIQSIGSPNIINLKIQQSQLIKRNRKKNQSDLAAQVTQQQSNKIKQFIKKNQQWINYITQKIPQTKIYQINYNIPQILAQPLINSILKPRVYLIQKHNNLTYQNIAIKYNMTFINLFKIKLRDCLSAIKKQNKRDVIICYYSNQQEKLISQDMYWIQKNVGAIRYLSVWNQQPKQSAVQMLQLIKPIKQQKKVKVQGQQGQQKPADQPPKQQAQQGQNKKAFDIYNYQWTKPGHHKNLSQWFTKLKKNITQLSTSSQQCYNKFHQTLELLNNSQSTNVYQIVK